MKNLYYNLSADQASHYASLNPNSDFIIITPFKEQPPEGYGLHCPVPYSDKWWIFSNGFSIISPKYDEIRVDIIYPFNARVGLRETWGYDFKGNAVGKTDYHTILSESEPWRSAQTMPKELWSYGTVVDVKVKRVREIIKQDIFNILYPNEDLMETSLLMQGFKDFINHRYPGSWEANKWCEVVTLRKEK